MVDTSERVTVRIPQELLEKLKRVQELKSTPTISDTIREGLEQFIELSLPPQHIRKVVVELSRQDNNRLEEFVRDGNSVSVDDAVWSAVREVHPGPHRPARSADARPPKGGRRGRGRGLPSTLTGPEGRCPTSCSLPKRSAPSP